MSHCHIQFLILLQVFGLGGDFLNVGFPLNSFKFDKITKKT